MNRGSPVDDQIRAEIDAAGGAIPFERFMDLALYGDHGFYVGGEANGSAGRRGDFITSPEVGPLFGAVLARVLDAEWVRLKRPAPFTVVDLGAGPGTLARSIVAAMPECAEALEYVAIEISPRQRAHHPEAARSAATLADAGLGRASVEGVVIANEVLDNVPFRLAVYDDGWREAFVVTRGDGTFAETLSDRFDPVPPVLPASAPHGARAPLQDTASRLVADAMSILSAGSLLVVDYCRATTAQIATLPWRDWLRTYRGHERGGHYLAGPGFQDITVDIAVDQLPIPDVVRSQAQFLRRWGIDELIDEGRRYWDEHASRPDLAAMRMRSRISEGQALLDPSGLGSFTVLEYRVDGREPGGERGAHR